MPFHYKALLIVIVITTVMFALAKPVFIRFMSAADFARRRNLWLALTLLAFVLPNIWLYMVIAGVAIFWAAKRDPNPIALYLFLLLLVPPVAADLPSFGFVSHIFVLDPLRLLSLVVLLPLALRVAGTRAGPGDNAGARSRVGIADVLIVLYVLLQIGLMYPHQSATATLRRTLELTMDLLLPYFVVSRSFRSREPIVEAMACFALSMVVLAPLGLYEFARGALLYAGIQDRWDTNYMISYLVRGDYLRAQVTGGHSIVFGFAMSIALGFWLYLGARVESRWLRWLVVMTLSCGLISTLARGPWVGALGIVVLSLALGPNAVARSFKGLAVMLVLGGIAWASPWGNSIVDHLPFVGSLNEDSVEYRQRLAEISWSLIRQNPLLGTPNFLSYMEELRQGEGIIDLVNTYAAIALAFGLVGLGLYVSFFVTVILRCANATRRLAATDPDSSRLGAVLTACICGAMLTIATTSTYLSIPYIQLTVAGLGMAYVQLRRDSTILPAARTSYPIDASHWPRARVSQPRVRS